jgi:outer membrane protein assembly factor BamD
MFFLALTLGILMAGGCGTTTASVQKDDPTGGEYTFNAKALIQKADGLFKDKKFIEAGQEYRSFLDLHPAHESAPYAQYRIGLCYHKQVDAIDRDMDPVYKALDAFQTLLSLYPESPYGADAREKITVLQNQLAEREFYVGKFYLGKHVFPAAIERFKNILQNYPNSPVVDQTLYHLALAYEASGDSSQAVESLKALLDRYPNTRFKVGASEVLSRLNGKEKSL